MPAVAACLTALLLAMPGPSDSPAPADSADFRLDDHRWEHRPLFVFAPSEDAADLAAQRDALAGTDDGFRDRDMLLVTVVDEGASRVRRQPSEDGRPLTGAAVRRLRERFDVAAAAFRVILVGKDGTEKRREAEPVAARVLFDQIDAMPMRQREMREGGGRP